MLFKPSRRVFFCFCFFFREQLKLFHSELLAQLEQKLELDIKYLTVSPHRPSVAPLL